MRSLTEKASKLGSIGTAREQQLARADGPSVGLMGRLFGSSRAPPPPSVEDVASTFFTVKGRTAEAHARAARHYQGAKETRGSEVAGGTSKVAGPWKPGAGAVSPGLGRAEEGGG